MKSIIIVVLCIISALSGTIAEAFSGSLDEESSVDDCKNALNDAKKSVDYYHSGNDDQIATNFYQLLIESITIDDVVTTELAFEKCLKYIGYIWHFGTRAKPTEWAISQAAMNGAEKIVKMLIDNDVDVDAKDTYLFGRTPLGWAASESGSLYLKVNQTRSQIYVNIAKMLIDHTANVSATDDLGFTPLHNAAKDGGEEIVRLLISKGVNVNAKSKSGYTPLHMAGQFNKANITKILLANGADINAKTNDGQTPLLFSALNGSKDVLKLLIDNGADVNARDKSGNGAFHLIVKYRKSNDPGYFDAIKLLIENNADKNIRNDDGGTACEIAKESRNIELLPALACEA